MLEVIRSSYHIIVLIILGIYFYSIKKMNKPIQLSHAKKAKLSLFVLVFSAATIWIVSVSDYSLTDQIQKIMTTFFVVAFALIWLASDYFLQSIERKHSNRDV